MPAATSAAAAAVPGRVASEKAAPGRVASEKAAPARVASATTVPVDVSVAGGRHRAAAKPSRTPVAAGAAVAAAAVAVTGFAVLDGSADSSSAVTSAASALGDVGGFAAASIDRPTAALAADVAAPAERAEAARRSADHPEAVRAARDRARSLLADRIEAVERKAVEAARAKLAARQKACGYNPNIQRALTSTADQRRHARTIIAVADRLDLPPRAAVIALATALQESFLRNINHGDRDSRGLFQQRPSMGWGSAAQVTNPEYSARAFYRALKEVDGWQRLPLTVAAQRVQISAFPWAYARWEKAAARLVANETDAAPEALLCRPR
ncbi:MAG: hypothetical protein ACT4QF_06195 [Sporichthyaceae bacterium]